MAFGIVAALNWLADRFWCRYLCPLGALLFFFGVDLFADSRNMIVAAALAFSAGAFICIALSDLLPEVHFHSHDRGKLTVAFLAGIAIAYAIGGLEPATAHLHTGQGGI